MEELLQAMAAFFNVFIYYVFLGQNQQICGGSSPASTNRDGDGSSLRIEASRCSTKNLKDSGKRPTKDECR